MCVDGRIKCNFRTETNVVGLLDLEGSSLGSYMIKKKKKGKPASGPLCQHFETPDFRACGCGTFHGHSCRSRLDPTWECGFKAFQRRLGQPNLTKITLIPKITDVLFLIVTRALTHCGGAVHMKFKAFSRRRIFIPVFRKQVSSNCMHTVQPNLYSRAFKDLIAN